MSYITKNNVTYPDYSFFNTKNFFGGTDPIRLIIVIYIFLSFILNLLNFIVFFITMKKAKIEVPLAIWVIISVIIVNFIHTATYFFQWVFKGEGIDTVEIEVNDTLVKVGGLLTGNPNNIASCITQGFLLIASSISQDFLINIFFYMVSFPIKNKEKFIKILIVCLGIAFPIIFTLILAVTGALGINDQFVM